MPPRKRAAPWSKKSNQSQQQSQKFGIQHFFERHTLSQNPKQASDFQDSDSVAIVPPPESKPISNSIAADPKNRKVTPQSPRKGLDLEKFDPSDTISATPKPKCVTNSCRQNPEVVLDSEICDLSNVGLATDKSKKGLNLLRKEINCSSQNSPSENLTPVGINPEENNSEASPETCKSVPVKRFKFSPGMLIKQSQDDGSDEVTWKISPVNERLHALSERIPDMMRALAESSRFNTMNLRKCPQNKASPGSTAKLEKWISSPPVKAAEKSLILSNRISLKPMNLDHDLDFHGSNGNDSKNNSSIVTDSQSPFKTPPSLPYCHDKPVDSAGRKGVSNQLASREHKKALIELLDQVEDVISAEESLSEDPEASLIEFMGRCYDERSVEVDPFVKTVDFEGQYRGRISELYFLVLEVYEKCRPIDQSGYEHSHKVLHLLNEQTGEERTVQLWDKWFDTIVAPGDTVHVVGDFNGHAICDVNNEKNYLIVHPEVLVSGTRVASSFSCPRRTVLDERLKSSEHSTAALIGTLLHQIFQAALIMEFPSKEFLEEFARVALQKNFENLYACGASQNDMHKTLIEAIPRILNWIHAFRDSQGTEIRSDNELKNIKISEVMDIEEMAWAPKYGLKGIIDASVRVKVELSTSSTRERIMPLELKTGKGTYGQSAVEHKAQVMLYTLLMSERYQKNINYGLLYYLHTDHTQEIEVERSNLIGLITRRNELANDILKASRTQELPPMLKSASMCQGCRHLNVCTIYHKAHGGSKEASGLGDTFDLLVNHLTTTHSAFLQKWDRLIDLEAKELEVVKKEIWCSHVFKREHSSSCLSPIVLDTSDKHSQICKGNRYIYRFMRPDIPRFDGKVNDEDSSSSASSQMKNMDCTLRCGDYVILSTERARLVVASGTIVDISQSHVSVSFSKRLRLPGSSPALKDLQREIWRIDKDEIMSSFAIMRFNLIQLFLENERSFHLRKMIVDLEAPRFDSGSIFSQDPAISYIWSERELNDDQRRAILKMLTAKDYALILGMPGTGKTSTLVHAVKALLMRGASILLTSYTNSAIDNLLIKLKAKGIDFLRIGRAEGVHEEVQEHCFSAMEMHSIEDIKVRLDQVKVVAATCLGTISPLLANKNFDVCIMDEAGQTTLPVSLGPLMFASTFVLVGDHYQLPPLVQSSEARENGMGKSLFCRLSEVHPQSISALQSQYRMCAKIMALSNALIYGNRLRCGSSEIENAKLEYKNSATVSPWLKEVLNPNRPVIFIDTDMVPALETKDSKSVNNQLEASIVAEVTDNLVQRGIEVQEIGIITPYNSQANLIREVVSTSVEIHTIDKYQGRDKDCILVSFVRSSENQRTCTSSLLGDWHRINVALTRAKKKLIMVGSCRTLSKVLLLKLLIEKVEEQSGILTLSKNDIIIHRNGELKRCSQFR